MTALLICVVIVSLVFALSNGLHDASSVVATFISCGAASPRQAIGLASAFGLLGAMFGGNEVATTISSVIDLPTKASLLPILLAALFGATIWNLVTWKLGLPSSSTHALVGGIVGAVVISSGYQHVLWGVQSLTGPGHKVTGIVKIILSLLISPLLGFLLAFFLEKLSKLLLRNAKFAVSGWINKLQWLISAGLSYNHGANDTQKIIGLVILALAAGEHSTVQAAPIWVRFAGGIFMFAGTMLGGWSIMKTIGRKIYNLQPMHSLNSQLASVGSILTANLTGAPVSTTHVVVGSVMGVAAADEYKMVHWGVVREILISWIITIPISAGISAVLYLVLEHIL
jgi:PiT family inorganic phosphate transporter